MLLFNNVLIANVLFAYVLFAEVLVTYVKFTNMLFANVLFANVCFNSYSNEMVRDCCLPLMKPGKFRTHKLGHLLVTPLSHTLCDTGHQVLL